MTIQKKSNPRLLMVLPTLGQRPALLKQTLQSLKDQAPFKFDLIMIFPLKNLETKKIAEDFGAIMLEDPGSLSAALNAGIAKADDNYEYIGWIGDDDLLTKGSLVAAVEQLDKNTKAAIAFGYCDYIDDNNNHIFTSRAGSLAPWIMTWGPNLVPLPGIVFRKSALDIAGKFDVDNKYSMDLDMLLRLRKIGKFINTKRVQACFRWHSTSTTVANRDAVLKETRDVKRKYLTKPLRTISPLWELPVAIATKITVKRVNNSIK
jgi:glycosyltransferase involved in cell wall biosynthesis